MVSGLFRTEFCGDRPGGEEAATVIGLQFSAQLNRLPVAQGGIDLHHLLGLRRNGPAGSEFSAALLCDRSKSRILKSGSHGGQSVGK